MTRGIKLLPLTKYRANSNIEKCDRHISKLYIRTSWAYLMREPFVAKKISASICVQNGNLSSRHKEINGKIAMTEKRTGNNLSHSKPSPPTPIQSFSKT